MHVQRKPTIVILDRLIQRYVIQYFLLYISSFFKLIGRLIIWPQIRPLFLLGTRQQFCMHHCTISIDVIITIFIYIVLIFSSITIIFKTINLPVLHHVWLEKKVCGVCLKTARVDKRQRGETVSWKRIFQ